MSSAPVQPNQRIHYLDLLRGFAITGVLFAYVFWNLGNQPSGNYTLFDNILNQMGYFIIDSKCYTILAALFSVGFVLHMNKSTDQAKNLYVYRRRLLGILLIGILHALLLRNGDILAPYAILSFISILFYKSSNRTIIFTLVIVFLLQAELPQIWRSLGLPFHQRPVNHGGNYWVQNFAWLKHWYTMSIFFWETTLLLLLAGLLIGRTFIQKGKTLSNRQLIVIAISGVLAGGLGYLVENFYESKLEALPDIGSTYILRAFLYYTITLIHQVGLASAYASVLFLSTKRFKLRVFANLGRMSLTNYILQATIVVPFCLAFNFFDNMTPTSALIMFAMIWTVQILFSGWWLKRYQFGPMEWLLRRFTYGKGVVHKKEIKQVEFIPTTIMFER